MELSQPERTSKPVEMQKVLGLSSAVEWIVLSAKVISTLEAGAGEGVHEGQVGV